MWGTSQSVSRPKKQSGTWSWHEWPWEARRGCASFGSWCVLQIWETGDSPDLGMASPQNVPVVGQHLCSRGGSRCRLLHVRHVQGISGAPGWGEGRALQVGTMGKETQNDCYWCSYFQRLVSPGDILGLTGTHTENINVSFKEETPSMHEIGSFKDWDQNNKNELIHTNVT